ncbi:MAG: hypothetical protein B7C24_13760 [Bacteroidetes bacterium 4572_77]|nr:MAG: hypothetical protein B7C24_13760 [Bacteroidetes bacterium 4572_77]
MILIAISHFVLRRGLEAVLRGGNLQQKMRSTSSVSKAMDIIRNDKPKLVYVDKKIGNQLKDVQSKYSGVWVPLVEEDKEGSEPFLNWKAPKALVLNALEQQLLLVGKPNKHKDTDRGLSDREMDVLRDVALGKTNKEIADDLFISSHTVITHRKNITRKLGIKTVSGLTVYAILNKIIQMEEI